MQSVAREAGVKRCGGGSKEGDGGEGDEEEDRGGYWAG